MPLSIHPVDYISPLQFIDNWRRLSRGQQTDLPSNNLGKFVVDVLSVLDSASYNQEYLRQIYLAGELCDTDAETIGSLGVNFPSLSLYGLTQGDCARAVDLGLEPHELMSQLDFIVDPMLELSSRFAPSEAFREELYRLIDPTVTHPPCEPVAGPFILPCVRGSTPGVMRNWATIDKTRQLSFHQRQGTAYPWDESYASRLYRDLPEEIKAAIDSSAGYSYRMPAPEAVLFMRIDRDNLPHADVGMCAMAEGCRYLTRLLYSKGLIDVPEDDLPYLQMVTIPDVLSRMLSVFSEGGTYTSVFTESPELPRNVLQYLVGRLYLRLRPNLDWRSTPELQTLTGR